MDYAIPSKLAPGHSPETDRNTIWPAVSVSRFSVYKSAAMCNNLMDDSNE